MTVARKYHHGNLREAFITAARDLLERDGLARLSLCKCAERVGVSHTAQKNHFGDMAGLLTAIVTRGYAELAEMMAGEMSGGTDCAQRRKGAIVGYVNFAKRNPALYDLMFSRDRLVNDDPNLVRQVGVCFVILADISVGLGWHEGDSNERDGKGQVALWSFVHGYAQLAIAGRFKKDNMKGLSILDVLPTIRSSD